MSRKQGKQIGRERRMKQNGTDRVHGAREGEVDQKSRARGSAPTCPKCGGTKYRDLASSDTHQRYECSSLDCMETFAVPIAGALASLNARKEEEEANPMAKVKKSLRCSKCNKAFAHEAWLEKHAAQCTGGGCTCAA